MATSTSRRTGIEPLDLWNASWVAGSLMSPRNASAFLAFFAFVAATKTSTTARKLPSVPGNATAPKSSSSCAPAAMSSPKAESFIDSKAQPPAASFFVAPSQVSPLRLRIGVAQQRREASQRRLHPVSAPVELVVDHVPPALLADRAQQRVLEQLGRGEAVLAAEAQRHRARSPRPSRGLRGTRRGCSRSAESSRRPARAAAVLNHRTLLRCAPVGTPYGVPSRISELRIVGCILPRRFCAREHRRDAAHHVAARVALHRLAGERLPDVGRVVVLQALRRARPARWSPRRRRRRR